MRMSCIAYGLNTWPAVKAWWRPVCLPAMQFDLHMCMLVGWLLHSLGTCIGAASMRHATGEQPWIRPGRAQGILAGQAPAHRLAYVCFSEQGVQRGRAEALKQAAAPKRGATTPHTHRSRTAATTNPTDPGDGGRQPPHKQQQGEGHPQNHTAQTDQKDSRKKLRRRHKSAQGAASKRQLRQQETEKRDRETEQGTGSPGSLRGIRAAAAAAAASASATSQACCACCRAVHLLRGSRAQESHQPGQWWCMCVFSWEGGALAQAEGRLEVASSSHQVAC